MVSEVRNTKTGGRDAIEGHIPGEFALAVGMPLTTPAKGWQWRKLTDLARLESGHTPTRKKPEYWGGDIPWIGIRDATGNHGRTIYDTNQHTNELGIKNSSARVLPANTVCLSRTASVGYVVVMGRPMATSQDFVNWICSDELDHQFLKYVLVAEKRSFLSFASGTTHQTIYFPEVKAFHICLPDLPTQKKIAGILSAYDDLIENNLRRIAILEEMAQSLYREWFVHIRIPSEVLTQAGLPAELKLVDSELGKIPEGWEVKACAQAVAIRPKVPVPKHDEIPFVPMGSLSVNSMLIGEAETRTKAAGARFQNGDTVFARITPCLENGKTGFVQFLPDDETICCGSTEFIVLRSKTLCPEYVYLMARSDAFRDNAIKSMTGATGRQRVRDECFEQFFLVQPPKQLLDKFQAIVQPKFKLIHALDLRNRNLRKTRDLLLPKLISSG